MKNIAIMLYLNIARAWNFWTNMKWISDETRTDYGTHVKAKKTKMPICKRFQCRRNLRVCTIRRLFPFMRSVRICRPFFRFYMRPRAKPVFVAALLHYASADTMTDETSRSDNCWLNLGLNDFSHERERRCFGRCRYTLDTFKRFINEQKLYFSTVELRL